MEIKNEHVMKLIKAYEASVKVKDEQLLSIKKNKSVARGSNDDILMNEIRKTEIHHLSERQAFIQFISDLESLDIAIDEGGSHA